MSKPIVSERARAPNLKNGPKKETFIAEIMRQKIDAPAPNTYEIDISSVKLPYNPLPTKAPRKSYVNEIIDQAKKYKVPGVGHYKVKPVTKRPLLGKLPKGDRIGYIGDAMWKGRASPGFRSPNFKSIERKSSQTIISPEHAVDKKKPEKVRLGPTSYDVADAFKRSQLPKPRFFMSNV